MIDRPTFLPAFLESKRKEIDALYDEYREHTLNAFLADTDYERPPLTRRQRLRIFVWRLRGWLAAPFAWVVGKLDPSRLARDE